MRGRVCVQAAVVAAILSGGAGVIGPDLFGIGSAEAKDYYTRKRVNGRWITGRFPKRDTEAPKAAQSVVPDKAPEASPHSPLPRSPSSSAAAPLPIMADADTAKEQNRLVDLKKALEQRARSMAARDSAPSSQPRSVTYDFDKGRKTIIHLDGTVTEEPLDPVATGQVKVRP